MKQLIKYLFFIALIFNACSPKLRYAISNPQLALSEKDILVVLTEDDTSNVNGTFIGTLFSGDNGFSVNCTYDQIMKGFRDVARKDGANIIKVVEHIYPHKNSSCDIVKVGLYRVANPTFYEKTIEWNEHRTLTLNDFKGDPDSNSQFAAGTYAEIKYRTNYVTIITKPKFFTTAIFYCYKSWIKPNQSNFQLLQHEQGHFDLCELYRRKLQKEFNETKISSITLVKKANEITNRYNDLYKERQTQYDDETNHGLNMSKQQEWQNAIAKELNELNDYRQQ